MNSIDRTRSVGSAYLILVCGVATLGGLLFGYDTAVISGAIEPVRIFFGLDAALKGWAAASALVGCVAGVLLAGPMNDRLGRKATLVAAAVLFLVSALGTALPRTTTEFVVFRIIGGFGVGIASMTSPMYIAEISPARLRGRMVSLNQLAIVTGMLVVYFVNFFIGSHGTSRNHQAASEFMKHLPPDAVLNEQATRIVEDRVASQIEFYRKNADQKAVDRMAAVLDQALEGTGTQGTERLDMLNNALDLKLEQWDSNAICRAVAVQLSEYGLKLDEECVGPLARQLAGQVESQLDIASLARGYMACLLGEELKAGQATTPVTPDEIAASLVGPLKGRGATAWNVSTGWRWMFGSEALPALLLLAALFLVPESPRFLCRKGKVERARAILERVDGAEHAEREIVEIQERLRREGGAFRELLRPGLRGVLVLGIALAVLQQVTGINVFLYYAPDIFRAVSGAGTDVALLQTIVVGAVNLLFTVVAILMVDRVGRRPLMIAGATGMGISLVAIGLASWGQAVGGWLLVFVLGYIASFAISVGPVTWVILSEIFPTKLRGRALGIATFFLWSANYLVSQSFPMMDENDWLVERFHHGFPFFVYAAFCAVLVIVVRRFVPETKGRSLEEIEACFGKP